MKQQKAETILKSKRQNSVRAKRAERQKSKRAERAKRAEGQKGKRAKRAKRAKIRAKAQTNRMPFLLIILSQTFEKSKLPWLSLCFRIFNHCHHYCSIFPLNPGLYTQTSKDLLGSPRQQERDFQSIVKILSSSSLLLLLLSI